MILKIIIFCLILEQVEGVLKLYKEALTAASFQLESMQQYDELDWQLLFNKSTASDSMCGSTKILGGYEILGYESLITNLIILIPHSQIRITLDFWKIDNWVTGEQISVHIDEQLIYRVAPNVILSQNICGSSSYNDFFVSIDKTIDHNFNSALLVIYTSLATTNVLYILIKTQGFWGISNFKLYIEECPLGCLICKKGEQPFQCLRWNLFFQSLTERSGLNIEGWIVTNNQGQSTYCSSLKFNILDIPLLCGYNLCARNSFISRSFLLPSHSMIKIHMKFMKIDSWDAGETAYFYTDNILINQFVGGSYQGYGLCGYAVKTPSFSGWRETSINVELNIKHQNQLLSLNITSNLDGIGTDESFGIRDIQIYLNNRCNYIYFYECCGDQIKQMGEECDDGNMIPFDGCHNCQFSCVDGCLLCSNSYCLECQEKWILVNNQCYFINNDASIQYPYNKNQRQAVMRTKNSFLQECERVFLEECLQCVQGWNQCRISQRFYKDQLYALVFTILNQEVKQSFIICDEMCNICIQSQCLQCNSNYYLNKLTNKCDNLCGDSIQSYNEQCDDGNNDIYDGCDSCQLIQYNKCNDKCSFCNYGQCERCSYGYSLYNNDCITVCGDFLVNKEQLNGQLIEECDNPNSDGCIDCHIKFGYQCVQQDISLCWTCSDQCTVCINEYNNLQCKKCEKGYYLKNNQCLKCDIECIACISLSYMCTEYYIEDKCDNDLGLYFNDSNNCVSKCGDGIIFNEQCDDGNNENSDGCSSNCEYEFVEQPIFKADLDSFDISTQIIILSFSQKVKRAQVSGQFIDKINATILNLPFNLTIKPITSADIKLNWVLYEIEVIIYENLNYKPKLQIKLLETLYNEENLPLKNQIQTVNLKKTYSLSESQQKIILGLADVHHKGTFSLGAVVALLFFLGCRVAVWTALELLQEQSYLRYINVIYPINLEIYLNQINYISLQPILIYFNFQNLQSFSQFKQAGDKFMLYDVNANIAFNIQSLVFSFICFFLMYFTLKYVVFILMDMQCAQDSFIVAQKIRKTKLFFQKLKFQLNKEGKYQLLLANSWDITFMSFLQLFYGTRDDILYNLLAIVLLGIIILSLIKNLKGSQKNQDFQDWNDRLENFILLKKLAFMAVLVLCQGNQNHQVNMLGVITTVYFFFLIKLKTFTTRKEFIKTFIKESSTMIFILSTQLYCEETFIILTSDQKILLGWFNIGLLLMNVGSNLFFDSFEAIQKLIEKDNQAKNKKLLSQNQIIKPMQKAQL